VLEIVERLCSHVAIIKKGQLVAQGSMEQLRAGVPGVAGRTLTLEDIFLSVVGQGADRAQIEELSWLT
jgi:ABC-2 type transport system ATP-binding protein